MAQAVIFIKYPGNAREGFEAIHRLARDADFILETQTLIESIHYVFGTSDYCAHVFAMSCDNIARAADVIKHRLDQTPTIKERGLKSELRSEISPPQTLTNTALGLGEEFIVRPERKRRDLVESVVNRAIKEAGPNKDPISEKRLREFAVETLVLEYFSERIKWLVDVDAALQHKGLHCLTALQRAALIESAGKNNGNGNPQADSPSSHIDLFDISPPISYNTATWSGDTSPSREVLLDMKKGDNITLSTLRTSVHIGAHADAPSHYNASAESIDERPLYFYIGPCQVIHVNAKPWSRILPEDIPCPIMAPRVLIATGTFPDHSRFDPNFAAVSPELVHWLHKSGVITIGIDTPSIDLSDSKTLPSHNAAFEHNMAILEGLRLSNVPPSVYDLTALPLPLIGFDASPVRAILQKRLRMDEGAQTSCQTRKCVVEAHEEPEPTEVHSTETRHD